MDFIVSLVQHTQVGMRYRYAVVDVLQQKGVHGFVVRGSGGRQNLARPRYSHHFLLLNKTLGVDILEAYAASHEVAP